MDFTKADYISWKTNPVTMSFLLTAIEEMNLSVKELVLYAGQNDKNDRFNCGRIAGLTWLTEWEPDFEEDKDES